MLSKKIGFVKRLVLRGRYLEGTWVGYYYSSYNDELHYSVETIEQDLSSLVARGKSFKLDNKIASHWISEAYLINEIKGKLIFTYNCESLVSHRSSKGIADYDFYRNSAISPAHIIHGFTADIQKSKRRPVFLKKISNRIMDFEEALGKAKQVALEKKASEYNKVVKDMEPRIIKN